MRHFKTILFLIAVSLVSGNCLAQLTVVRGIVTDAETKEPIGFATVSFQGTATAVYTNDNGVYEIKTDKPGDSIIVAFFGYQTIKRAIVKGKEQNINVGLPSSATVLQSIVLTNREDPAYPVIRKAIANKERFDKRKLQAYEYESFTRVSGSFDQIPGAIKNQPIGKEIASILDSLGTKSFPFFASEAVSRYYYRTSPEKSTEKILGTKVTGVFVEDGSMISQIIGSTFQNYNFYENWMKIVGKDFISPIADGALGFYEYRLTDTVIRGGKTTFKIEITPKREQDLAFNGYIWIEDSTYALSKVRVEVAKEANLNYVNLIKIEQELVSTSAGPLLPEYTEVYIKLSPFSEKSTGLESQFKTYNTDFVVNAPKPLKFYEYPVEVDEEAAQRKAEFWTSKRVEPLTTEEQKIYAVIDTVKNIPRVKTYVEVINTIVNGYVRTKYLDAGQYMSLYAWNDIEGSRFRPGVRTNIKFSNKWVLAGYGAYGTRDQRIKYYGEAGYIFNRKKWTKITAAYKYDLDQIAIPEDKLEDNNGLFLAFTRWGILRGPTYNRTASFSFFRQYSRDFSQNVMLRHREFNPAFAYAYYKGTNSTDIYHNLTASELVIDSKYARDEFFVVNDNDRISLGTRSWPVLRVKLTLGLKGIAGSAFNYQKADVSISDNIKIGALGRSYFDLSAGKIFGTVPLPLLEVPLGNQTPFYTTAGYNLMRYFEFVNDKYVSLKYRHYFEGLFFNRIPLIKKLNWRFLASGNVLFGGLSSANRAINASRDEAGNETMPIRSLGSTPYAEIGYGIENIFKVIRIDAFHRLTYLENPGANKFGVKFSLQFAL